jgi:hypothetical protein
LVCFIPASVGEAHRQSIVGREPNQALGAESEGHLKVLALHLGERPGRHCSSRASVWPAFG